MALKPTARRWPTKFSMICLIVVRITLYVLLSVSLFGKKKLKTSLQNISYTKTPVKRSAGEITREPDQHLVKQSAWKPQFFSSTLLSNMMIIFLLQHIGKIRIRVIETKYSFAIKMQPLTCGSWICLSASVTEKSAYPFPGTLARFQISLILFWLIQIVPMT